MKKRYFESLETGIYNDYLMSNPTKKGCLNNAQIAGDVEILKNSNNRALIIRTEEGTKVFLQSYDTLILTIDLFSGEVKKLWNGYSVTTLKHINEFLKGSGLQFNKKSWLDFEGTFLYI